MNLRKVSWASQRAPRLVRPIPIALVLCALIAGNALAHSGTGQVSSDRGLLEGESYSRPLRGCHRDADREETRPWDYQTSSGGQYAFAPHSGCGFFWRALTFWGTCVPQSAYLRISGAATDFEGQLLLRGPGVRLATATIVANPTHSPDGWTQVSFDEGPSMTGNGRLRVSYDLTRGPSYGNLELDFIQFSPDCQIRLGPTPSPRPPPPPSPAGR